MRFSRLLVPAALGILIQAPAAVRAQQTDIAALYTACAFHPQGAECEPVYQRALKDSSPGAAAVRDAFTFYARYLKNSAARLSDADRQFLKANNIVLPMGLSVADQAGLHNVIHDPSLSNAARVDAVNNFLARAVQAELYCSFNSCDAKPAEAMS